MVNNHWPSQTSWYTFSIQQKATNLHKTYCIKVWWNGLRKYGTCFATFLQKELNADVRRSTTCVQTCLVTHQVVVAVCKKLLQKVQSSSTFSTKSEHVAHFTGPRQTRFCSQWRNSCVWRDSCIILSNQKSVFTQHSRPDLQQSFKTSCPFLLPVALLLLNTYFSSKGKYTRNSGQSTTPSRWKSYLQPYKGYSPFFSKVTL